MKHFGLIYKNKEQLENFIKDLNIQNSKQVLIQVFTGIINHPFIKNLIDELTLHLPDAEIIGLTSAGEIFEGKILSDNTIISFTIFDNVKLKTILIKNDGNEVGIGQEIYKRIIDEETRLLMIFTDGLITSGGEIVKTLQNYDNNLKICGAKAGDNGSFEKTYVFSKDGILSSGVVAVSLSGNDLSVTIKSSFCWSSIGKIMKITKATQNRIYTIDDVPAIEVYKKYLGIGIENNLIMTTTEFPLIIKKDGVDVARVAYKAYEDGSLDFYGNVNVGDEVQFGYGNINMITQNSLEIIESLSKEPIDLIFVYSCYVRKTFLGKDINLEIEPLNNIAPCYGYFTYGEFFSNNSSNPLFNVTMLMIGITENPNKNNKNFKPQTFKKSLSTKNELRIIKTFSNLANQIILELEDANNLLKNQKEVLERLQKVSATILDINNRIIYYSDDYSIFNTILDKIIELIPNAQFSSILFVKENITYYSSKSSEYQEYIKNINNYVVKLNFKKSQKNKSCFSPIIINSKKCFEKLGLKELNHLNKSFELITCCIPLENKDIAIITIFSDSKNKFSLEDLTIVEHMAYEIAIVFKNAKFLERILYLYKYDRLTGIFNRNYFVELIRDVYKEALFNHTNFTICMIDLDKFKEINDRYGHDVGDLYLVKFINILKKHLNTEDFIGRVGGDEFEILFMNKNKISVMDVMKIILDDFNKNPFVYNEFSRIIKFSYGIAEFPMDSEKIRDLIKIADNRMYEDKRNK